MKYLNPDILKSNLLIPVKTIIFKYTFFFFQVVW